MLGCNPGAREARKHLAVSILQVLGRRYQTGQPPGEDPLVVQRCTGARRESTRNPFHQVHRQVVLRIFPCEARRAHQLGQPHGEASP